MSDPLRFLSRWSRLKRQAAAGAAAPPPEPVAEAPAVPAAVPATTTALPAPAANAPPGIDADLAAAMQDAGNEGLRRLALKKLFADPHFNVMDGLDTYIDDYSISEPIPEAMLAGLNQMQRLFPSEAREETAATPEPAGAAPVEVAADANCDIPPQDGQNEPPDPCKPAA